jgi:hypothetical protein
LGSFEIPVARDQQSTPPVLGTGVVASPEQDPLQVAELVEEKQRVGAK